VAARGARAADEASEIGLLGAGTSSTYGPWVAAFGKRLCELGWIEGRNVGGADGSGAPPGKRNAQYRHGERTKAAIAERQKFSALLRMLRAGLA
jgi:hypothetical protein